MNQKELQQFSQRVSDHLHGHILPFWCGPAVDREHGGWLAWLSNDLWPDRTQPKGLIVNSRILWAFSAAYRARPEPIYQEMAQRALDVVMNSFWDAEYGGAFWQLADAGQVRDDSKKTYGQAFYIYAFAEYYRTFSTAAALERAKALFELVERHAHDPKFSGYFEVCHRDWTVAGPEARLSDKDLSEKKSMNNHLHVLEAYTNLHRVWPEPRVEHRLRELIDLFLTRIITPHTHHLDHFFDERWQIRSDTYTFGHDIEASWLLCEAAEELGDGMLLQRVRKVALPLAEAVFYQGVTRSGAIAYEGKNGQIIDPGLECWPQAEALVGFLNAFELSHAEQYLAAAARVWNFIESTLADRQHGEWFWRVNPDGRPDPKLPKVSEWKGPYHGTRACLETLRRLQYIGGY